MDIKYNFLELAEKFIRDNVENGSIQIINSNIILSNLENKFKEIYYDSASDQGLHNQSIIAKLIAKEAKFRKFLNKIEVDNPEAFDLLREGKILCDHCADVAQWLYMPKDGAYCDDCVPRGCYCNLDDNQIEMLDEQGRLFPCVEYHYSEVGFDE